MKMFSKRLSMDSFTNLVSEGTIINGNVSFIGIIKIQGTVTGDIFAMAGDMKDCIIIDKTGSVTSDKIQSTDAIISGNVSSQVIWVEDTLRVLSGARITHADIYYRNLEIEPGAIIHESNLIHLDHVSSKQCEQCD